MSTADITTITEAEIRRQPVTGLPGRTPRDEIEVPRTAGREIEPILIIDVSGSNEEASAPGSPVTKHQLIVQAVPGIVVALEADDSQAAREQADGDEDMGGLLTFTFSDPGYAAEVGDLNSANYEHKLAKIEWGGTTHVMDAIHLAEEAFQEEFGDRPMRNRPAQEILIITDGMLSDAAEFETWVAQADETAVVAVAVVGYGDGHDRAVDHYKKIAATNKFVTVVALTGVSDPNEVALDLRLLSGTAPAAK